MDKHITKNINLNNLVRMNPKRSYREGNLMQLNYQIIDAEGAFIFSISFDTDRFANDEEIDRVVSKYKYEINYLAFKLCIHANNRGWFSLLDMYGICKKFANPTSMQEFIDYIGEYMIAQVVEDVHNLDFFSLQTKEEYEVHYKKIEEFIADTRGLLLQKANEKKYGDLNELMNCIADEEIPLNTYWGEYLAEELADQDYLDWINERQLELTIYISDEAPENFKEAANCFENIGDNE